MLKMCSTFYQMLADLNKNREITLLLVTHDIGTISDKVTHVACLNKNLHFHGETKEFEQIREVKDCLIFMVMMFTCSHITMITEEHLNDSGNFPI